MGLPEGDFVDQYAQYYSAPNDGSRRYQVDIDHGTIEVFVFGGDSCIALTSCTLVR